jgi:hypothetical protein
MSSLQRESLVSMRQNLTDLGTRTFRFTHFCPQETRGDLHMLILLYNALKNCHTLRWRGLTSPVGIGSTETVDGDGGVAVGQTTCYLGHGR